MSICSSAVAIPAEYDGAKSTSKSYFAWTLPAPHYNYFDSYITFMFLRTIDIILGADVRLLFPAANAAIAVRPPPHVLLHLGRTNPKVSLLDR